MKKIKFILPDYVAIVLAAITIMLCTFSCTIKEPRYNNISTKVKADTIYINRGRYYNDFIVIKFNYDGHSYLYMVETNSKSSYKNVLHDPNCECFKKYIPKEKSIFDY